MRINTLTNPKKYSLFKTARLAVRVPTSPAFSVGEILRIKFLFTAKNKMQGNVEVPVYWVEPQHQTTGANKQPAMLYANALGDFVL
jgi:hypothetical protein